MTVGITQESHTDGGVDFWRHVVVRGHTGYIPGFHMHRRHQCASKRRVHSSSSASCVQYTTKNVIRYICNWTLDTLYHQSYDHTHAEGHQIKTKEERHKPNEDVTPNITCRLKDSPPLSPLRLCHASCSALQDLQRLHAAYYKAEQDYYDATAVSYTHLTLPTILRV